MERFSSGFLLAIIFTIASFSISVHASELKDKIPDQDEILTSSEADSTKKTFKSFLDKIISDTNNQVLYPPVISLNAENGEARTIYGYEAADGNNAAYSVFVGTRAGYGSSTMGQSV